MLNIGDTTTFVWGAFFGIIGFGFFRYGRKKHAMVPLFSGISLMLFPYFISNIYALVSVGVGLSLIPFFVKI